MGYRLAIRHLVILLATVVLQVPEFATGQSLESARRDIRRLRYDEAEDKLVDVARTSHGSKRQAALYLLAGLKQSVKEAEIIYQELIRIDASSEWAIRAQLELAKIHYAAGNYGQALVILEESDACRFLDEGCYFEGMCSMLLKRYPQAREAFDRIERGRFRPWAYLSLAEIDMMTDRADEACQRYQSMSRANLNPTAMYRYGECLERQGNAADARGVFREITTAFADTPEAVRATEKLHAIEATQTVSNQESNFDNEPRELAPFEEGGFTIQFGAFRDRENAIKMAAQIKKTLPGVRIDTDLVRFREIHRVRYGYFRTREEAQAKAQEISGLIDERSTIMMLSR